MNTFEQPRPLLTVPQTAERLGLSVQTVRRRIREGALPAVTVGTGPQAPVRIDPEELDRFIYGPSVDVI